MPGNDTVPQEIRDLADARAVARRARDWPTADRLRGEIEAAGWRLIDAGTLYSLERAGAPDIVDGGVVRHGSSRSVPSRLEDAPVGVATVVMVAAEWPDDLARALRALVDHSADGTQLVVVANAPSTAQEERLAALDAADPGAPGITTEVVWTSGRLGHAAAVNAGIRRAAAPVVVLLDTSIEPRGDLVGSLVAALDDPTVAVTGPYGIVSADLRRFQEAPATTVDVDAIDGCAIAFRRTDYAARGPLDEHFVFSRSLGIWWSLVLRDRDPEAPEHTAPRRALRVSDVRIVRHEDRSSTSISDAERDRGAKRDYYRVLKRFATRRDLLVGG